MNYGPEVTTYQDQTIGYFGLKALPFHNGHVNMILRASQQVDILFVVIGYDEVFEREYCKGSKMKYVDHRVRERWVTQTFKHMPNIRVLSNYERRSDDYLEDPSIIEANQELLRKVGGRIDIAFSSEAIYGYYFAMVLPNAKHVVLDEQREDVPISATQIRTEGIYKHWHMLPRSVQDYYTIRLAFCGIESVGKSTLVKMLAAAFNTVFVEEYGRTYYDEINSYHDIAQPKDFLDIAAGHVHRINQATPFANQILLIDTDMVYTQFFIEKDTAFNGEVDLSHFILQEAEGIDYRIYLHPKHAHHLDGTRRPVTDEQRMKNNNHLLSLYKQFELDVIEVTPDIDNVFEHVKEIIRELLGEPKQMLVTA